MPVHRKRSTAATRRRPRRSSAAALRPYAYATKQLGGVPHKGTAAYRRWIQIARSRM